MATKVADVLVEFNADDSDLKKAAKDATASLNGVGKSGSGIGAKIKSGLATAGKAIAAGAAVAGAAMGALVVSSFKAAGDLEQNIGGSEAVFGEFADTVQQKGAEAYKNLGLSQSAYLASANKMGSLLQGAGFDQSTALTLTSDAMQRAADVASIMGISTESAMEAINGAAKGNFTMMDNLGVAMNDTAIGAYAMEQGITKSTQQMTQQEKTGLALQMFMDKTAFAAGNYAKENETLAGSMSTAKAAFENFLSGSGSPQALADSLVNAGNAVTRMAGELLPGLVSGLSEVINALMPQIPTILQSVLPTIITGITGLMSSVVAMIPTLMPTLISGLMQLVQGILTILPQILNAGMQIMIALFVGIGEALPTLIPQLVEVLMQMVQVLIDNLPLLLDAGIQLLQGFIDGLMQSIPVLVSYLPKIIDSIVNFLVKSIPMLIDAGIDLLLALVDNLPAIINGIVAALPQIITAVIDALIKAIPQLIDAGVQLFIALVENLPAIISAIVAAIPQIIRSLVGAIGGALGQLAQAGLELLSAIGQNVGGAISSIVTAMGQIPGQIISTIGGWASQVIEAGKNLIGGLATGITNGIGSVVSAISNAVSGAINKAKELLGIASPSKVFKEIGKFTAQGLAAGIKGNAKEVIASMEKVLDQLTGSAKKIAKTFSDQLVKSAKSMEKLNTKIKDQKKVLADLKEEMKDYAAGIKESFANFGSLGNLSDEAVQSVSGMLGELQSKLEQSKQMAANIKALQQQGLSEDAINSILDMGVEEGGAFAATLATATDAEIAEINRLQGEITKQGAALGAKLSKEYYQAGVDAAKGLLEGLESQKAQLAEQMADIAKALTNTIKKELKIKSPSRVLMDIGDQAGQGVGIGLESVIGTVTKAAKAVATAATSTVRDGMSDFGKVASSALSDASGDFIGSVTAEIMGQRKSRDTARAQAQQQEAERLRQQAKTKDISTRKQPLIGQIIVPDGADPMAFAQQIGARVRFA